MSYLVFCTFDLKNASTQDYKNAYTDLAAIGLHRVVTADNNNQVVIPTTSAMGSFNGASSAAIRDNIRNRVQAAFHARGFTSEIFVTAGGQDWAWGSATT